jgi:hypothetical protein
VQLNCFIHYLVLFNLNGVFEMLTIRTLIFVVVLFAMEYTAFSQSPFYRRYEGKYGKQHMVVNFSYQAGGLSGNYYIKDNPVVKEFGGKSTLAGTYAYFEILSDSAQVGTSAIETLSGVLAGPKFDGSHRIAETNQSTQFSLREGYKDATEIKLNTIRDDVRKSDYGMVLYITINYPLIGEKVFDDAVKVYTDSFIGSGKKPMMDYLDETIANYKKIVSDTNNTAPPRKNYRIMTDVQMNDRNIVSVHLAGTIKEDEKDEIKSDFILNYNKESNSVITTDNILKGEWTKLVNERFKDTFNDEKINYQASNTVGKQNFIVQADGIKFLITDSKHVPIHQIKLTYNELNEFLTGSLPL